MVDEPAHPCRLVSPSAHFILVLGISCFTASTPFTEAGCVSGAGIVTPDVSEKTISFFILFRLFRWLACVLACFLSE